MLPSNFFFQFLLLLLLLASPLFAQSGAPMVVGGTVFDVTWIHGPGISNTGSYTLTWSSALGATDYQLEEDTNASFTNATQIYQGPNTSFNVTGRQNGTYYYRVRGIDTVNATSGNYRTGYNPHVVDSTVSSVPAIPASPTGVTAPPFPTILTFPVSWTAVTGANGYDLDVQWQLQPSQPLGWMPYAMAATGIPQSPYSYTSINNNIDFYFRARAYVNVGSYRLYSLFSAPSNLCILMAPSPPPPAFITVPQNSATGSYTVSWGTSTGATSYDLQEDTNPAFTNPQLVVSGAGTSFGVTGRASGTYYYRVRAVAQSIPSSWTVGSNGCTVTIQIPGPPSFLTVPANSSTGSYTLNWGNASNAASYDLEEDVNPSFTSALTVYSGPALNFSVSGKPNGTYYYRVRGTNPLFQGPYTAGSNACLVDIRGTLTLAGGPANIPSSEFQGFTGIVVLQVALAADAVENIDVTSLWFTHTGTLDLAADVTAIGLHRDTNGNGVLDGGDLTLATGPALSAGGFQFGSLSETVTASSAQNWLVTYDLDPAVPLGRTFQASIAQNGDVTVSGSLTTNPLVTGAPVSGGLKTVADVGSLTLSQGSGGTPSDLTAYPGTTGVPLLHLALTAGSVEPIALTGLTVTGLGTGNEATEIAGVSLYLDSDGDGIFNPTLDSLLAGPEVFLADDGAIPFTFFRVIPASGRETVFVIADLATGATAGSTFRVGVLADLDVTASGSRSGGTSTILGAPVLGGTLAVVAVPARSDRGGCHASGGGSGGDSPLSWALLALAFLACLGSARMHLGRERRN
ncbi:MAG: fibronectin type III domain-containing protein [Planctomycetota bacterium]|jgi:hypothetical protein